MNSKTIVGPKGYSIVLDRRQVFLDDPGQGTPAILEGPNGASSTFWCALGEGEIETTFGPRALPSLVVEWLEASESAVNSFLYGQKV